MGEDDEGLDTAAEIGFTDVVAGSVGEDGPSFSVTGDALGLGLGKEFSAPAIGLELGELGTFESGD